MFGLPPVAAARDCAGVGGGCRWGSHVNEEWTQWKKPEAALAVRDVHAFWHVCDRSSGMAMQCISNLYERALPLTLPDERISTGTATVRERRIFPRSPLSPCASSTGCVDEWKH